MSVTSSQRRERRPKGGGYSDAGSGIRGRKTCRRALTSSSAPVVGSCLAFLSASPAGRSVTTPGFVELVMLVSGCSAEEHDWLRIQCRKKLKEGSADDDDVESGIDVRISSQTLVSLVY